jgi:hypothetical protein
LTVNEEYGGELNGVRLEKSLGKKLAIYMNSMNDPIAFALGIL